MRFDWDENKRTANLAKHGFDFKDAYKIFEQPIFTITDVRFDYNEVRYFTPGLLTGRVVALSHTDHNEVIRIISLRRANKYEQKIYYTEI